MVPTAALSVVTVLAQAGRFLKLILGQACGVLLDSVDILHMHALTYDAHPAYNVYSSPSRKMARLL